MSPASLTIPRHRWLKALVFVLIAVNAAIYSMDGAVSAAVDTVAWLTLLVLFELETSHAPLLRNRRMLHAVHGLRLAAAAAVSAVAASYAYSKSWLDAGNAGLWLGVVALLEFEVRYPRAVERHRTRFSAVAALLYSGFAVMVLAWAWGGAWFDAYDALLWLGAFVALEMKVLGPPA